MISWDKQQSLKSFSGGETEAKPYLTVLVTVDNWKCLLMNWNRRVQQWKAFFTEINRRNNDAARYTMWETYWSTPFNHWVEGLSIQWPQMYKIKHLARQSALTTIVTGLFKRAYWICMWYCKRMSLLHVFPSRYSSSGCKWYYSKVELFRNHSNSTTKW